MTRCKIFQLDASYSPPHPSNTCSSQTTPPPSPSLINAVFDFALQILQAKTTHLDLPIMLS